MNNHDSPTTQEVEAFNIPRALGRIEEAVCNMASDIHDAVVAQKAIVERLEKDELRLYSLEEWRKSSHSRNVTLGKIAFTLLLPLAVWVGTIGIHLTKLTQKMELYEQTFPRPNRP